MDRQSLPHTFVGLDALAQTFLPPTNDPFGSVLGNRNLSAISHNAQNAEGVSDRLLLVARVDKPNADVEAIVRAVSPATVCELRARGATLVRRVQNREIGSGYSRP